MSIPSLNLAFRCRACGGTFQGIPDWNQHLLQEAHLREARKSVLRWGEGERSCALIIFAKSPVGRDGRVVDYLSSLFGGRTIVQDFVWWEGRPKIGVAQFGSSAEVSRIVASMENKQFLIEPDLLCHVKEGSAMPEVEWEGLLPEEGEGSERSLHLDPTSSLQSTLGQQPPATPSPSVTELISPSRIAESPGIRSVGLRNCLIPILNWIQIPKKEGNGTNDILQRFQTLLDEYGGGKNQLNVCLGGLWHLRFHYPPKEDLGSIPLPFILRRVTVGDAMVTFSSHEFQEIQTKLFALEQGQMLFLSNCPVLSPIQEKPSGKEVHFSIKHPATNKFTDVVISAEPPSVVADQLWRLIRILSRFDPYVFSLLAAANYWAATNSIYIGVGAMEGNFMNMPDPTGLNLLVLLFCQMKGLIPTCKMIFEQKHFVRLYEGTDFGFSENNKHADKWRTNRGTMDTDPRSESFAEELFTLLYKFFNFCGDLLEGEDKLGGGRLLNTRDGKVIPMIDVVTGSVTESDSGLSTDEIVDLRRSLGAAGNREKIVVLNPFCINWRISMVNAERAFGAMMETGNRLRDYMETKVHAGVADLDLEEFFKLLKIEENEITARPALDPRLRNVVKIEHPGPSQNEENDMTTRPDLDPRIRNAARMDDHSQNHPSIPTIPSIGNSLRRNPDPDKIVMPHPFSVRNSEQLVRGRKETGTGLTGYFANRWGGEERERTCQEFLGSLKVGDGRDQEEVEMLDDDLAYLANSERSQTDHVDADNYADLSHEDEGDLDDAPPPKRSRLIGKENNNENIGFGDYLRTILRRIEIPQEDYKIAERIISGIQGLLSKDNSATDQCQVVMTRHYALKLQYSPNIPNRNIAFSALICKATNFEERLGTLKQLRELDDQLIKYGGTGRRKYLLSRSYELKTTRHLLDVRDSGWGILRYTISHPRTHRSFDIHVLNDPRFIVEAQMFRLVEYLCTFHPLCYPVLAVTYYWAKVNSIALGKFTGSCCQDMASPSALNWLLIVFFQKEGLIPSPRLVLERPHQRRTFEGVDVGFSDDARFTDDWRASNKKNRNQSLRGEHFAKQVFNLFHNFLSFCCSELGGDLSDGVRDRVVVNTRDGEIVRMEQLLSSASPTGMGACKLTASEIDQIKLNPKTARPNWIIMLNPFYMRWKISTTNADATIEEAMRKTARELRHYLESEQGKREREMLRVNDFLKLFKLKK